MDDKTAKELTKALNANTNATKELSRLLRRQSQRVKEDPAQPEGTEKMSG